ncbi:MAG: FtsW/RodA/SpoVE family cell cycle protein [Patescibacteria group bacterium]
MKISRKKGMDIQFLAVVILLSFGGFLIFLSAATSVLAKGNGNFAKMIITQSSALVLGLILMFVLSHVYYRFWRKYAFIVLMMSIVLTLLVFIPGLGLSHGGAVRWLNIGPLTIQPAEFLQLGFVIYCSAWLSGITSKINNIYFGFLPLIMILGLFSLILLSQRDTGSLAIIATSGFAMFFIAGARWRDILSFLGIGLAGITALLVHRPYIYERFFTLFNPSAADSLGSGYQTNQSLIAIGTGEWFGRGFGQSIQKFRFLPEAPSDSIFAVVGEELGFIGAFLIVAAFVFLAWRGINIALRAPDVFARLLVVGIVIMIITQAFIHIGGMVKLFPLSGIPLPFISLGGTSLLFSLAAVGIVLNVSRYSTKK